MPMSELNRFHYTRSDYGNLSRRSNQGDGVSRDQLSRHQPLTDLQGDLVAAQGDEQPSQRLGPAGAGRPLRVGRTPRPLRPGPT